MAIFGGAPNTFAEGTGAIDDLRLGGNEEHGEIEVRFSFPIQYLRHAPIASGDSLIVQLESLATGGSTLIAAQRDSRKARRGNPIGLVEVVYGRDTAGQTELEFRFKRRVRFEVFQGAEFRSIVVRTEPERTFSPPPDVDRYAVELYEAPVREDRTDPDLEVPEDLAFYRIPLWKESEAWERVQVGFFNSPEAALDFQRMVRSQFPDARVIPVKTEDAQEAQSLRFAPLPVPRTRRRSTTGLPAASDATKALMQRARHALTAGDPKQAIPLLTKILTQSEHSLTPEAKELLGVARERNGQLAHAKAEYEEYLERYPETEGATRVRQRLDAMITAAKPGRERLPVRRSAGGRDGIRWDSFGSLSTFYRYDARAIDPIGSVNTDSSLHSHFFGGVRAQLPRVDLRSEASASYTADFLPGNSNQRRFRSAFVQVDDREGPLSGHVGRRSANSGGVIERFDGGRVHYELPNQWGVALVAGLPVNIFTSNQIRTDKKFAGLAVDFHGLERSVSGEFFGIAQEAYGFLDRAAIGSELRYFRNGLSLASLIDFDVYYTTLNTAFLTGFWQLSADTHLNLLIDYRTSPILTTSNAVIGLGEDNLGDIEDRFSRSELKELAEDRTTTSKLGNIGVTHRLNERFQISSDFSVSSFGSTDDTNLDPDQIDPFDPFALDQIPGNDAVGPDYALYTQLIGSSLLKEGDTGIAGIRLQKGDPTDFVSLILNSRYPVVRGLRANPLIRLDYRRSAGDSEALVVRPTLRFDYKYRRFTFDLRGDFLWEKNFGADAQSDELGYTGTVGVRYDF